MSRVQDEVNQILTGVGWATDDYVLNFCDLPESEQLQVMIKLAKLGKLYKEDSIGNYMDDSEPKTGRMTVDDVTQIFMK